MTAFLETLRSRNSLLYIFGWLFLLSAAVSLILIFTSNKQVLGVNAWIKPFKFFLSSAIFVWTMAWLMHYLTEQNKVTVYSWIVIVVLVFETSYIALQAARGQLSHFNVSTSFHSAMFSLMGIAILIMTLWTGYIGLLFFTDEVITLSPSYLWGIRLGIILFVVFAIQGGVMGAYMKHTVGTADGGKGLPLVNWSKTNGDLRIAHFIGMHALQILPLAGYYFSKTAKEIIVISILYFSITIALLVQALMGKPFLKF
jgi:hypothetical protein